MVSFGLLREDYWTENIDNNNYQRHGENVKTQNADIRKEHKMKGYVVESGYMGYMNDGYYLFADESDYEEAYLESIG